MQSPALNSAAARRKGKIAGWTATHLRRGQRDIEDKEFQIANLRKELEKLNVVQEKSNGNLPKLDKDGIKGLQKELKDTKYHISTMETDLSDLKPLMVSLNTALEAERTILEKLDPSYNQSKIRPELQSFLSPLQDDLYILNLGLKETSSNMNHLSEEVNGIEEEDKKLKRMLLELKKELANDVTTIKSLKGIIASKRKSLPSFSGRNTAGLASALESTAASRKQLEILKEQIDKLNLSITTISNDNASILLDRKEKLEAMNTTYSEKKITVEQLVSRIRERNELDSPVRVSMRNKLDDLGITQSNWQRVVDAIQHNLSILNQDITDLTTKITTIKSTESFLLTQNQSLLSANAESESSTEAILKLKSDNQANIESQKIELDSQRLSLLEKIRLEKLVFKNLKGSETLLNKREQAQVQVQKRVESSNADKKQKASEQKASEELKLKMEVRRKLEKVMEESKEDEEESKKLELRLKERESRAMSPSKVLPPRYSKLDKSSLDEGRSSSPTSSVIQRLVATLNEVTLRLDELSKDNTQLVLKLAGVEV